MCIFISPIRIDQLSREKMVDYEVTVITGSRLYSFTYDYIYVKLVGTDGESERTCFNTTKAFVTGAVSLEDQAQSLNVSNVSSVLPHMNIHKLSLMFSNKICAA